MPLKIKGNQLIELNRVRILLLVMLRIAIGWHFLYEGIVKLHKPNWSSYSYLLDSKGFLSEYFIYIAQKAEILKIVDLVNVWGLIAIGLGLILGAFTSVAIISGILLLSLYYLSHPIFIGLNYSMLNGGNYLIVDRIIIEIFALTIVLAFPTWKIIGIDRLFLILKTNLCGDRNERKL